LQYHNSPLVFGLHAYWWIAFEIDHFCTYQTSVTLTSNRVIWHTAVYHSSISTYIPNSNFIQIRQNFFTGCSGKNCTKFKHHNFATVHHRVTPFASKCSLQKENVYTTKASVWIWQLNIHCYLAGKWTIWKQSNRLGDTSHFVFALAYTQSFWLLEGVSTVKIFSPENKVWHILLWVIRFFKRLHAFNRFSLSAAVRVWTSGRQNTANHSWQFSQLKNVEFQSLSRDLPWTITYTCSCSSWQQIKSLINSMFESVLTESRWPLPGSLSVESSILLTT